MSRACDDYLPLLDLHAGGDLEPGELVALEAHLEGCPACRGRLEAARAALARLALLREPAGELPELGDPGFWEDMTDEVMARVRTPRRAARPAGPSLWFASGFAAAALLLFAVWLGFGRDQAPEPAGPGLATAEPGRGTLVPVWGPLRPEGRTRGADLPEGWPAFLRRLQVQEGPVGTEAVPAGTRSPF